MKRWMAFNLVGLAGVGVQLAALALLTHAGWPVLAATALAVESAILHNFAWHERWTWSDRRVKGAQRLARLGHFHLANGAVSLGGNLAVMFVLHTLGGVPVLAANLAAIAACGLVNFVASDRLVFRMATAAGLAIAVSSPASAQPSQGTLAAWDAYVTSTEARVERELRSSGPFLTTDFEAGTAADQARARVRSGESVVARMMTTAPDNAGIDVAGGRIHHWRGALLIPGIGLDDLLGRLQHPPTGGPYPSDVLEMRVIERHGDELKVFMKLSRSWIVTAMYNTEHAARYRRHQPRRASSRSISTRIVEVARTADGREREKPPSEDRGFLWRLNSYWRYEEIDEGVIVECESVSLSRGVPYALRPFIGSTVDRIARESMERTLTSLRTLYGKPRRSPVS